MSKPISFSVPEDDRQEIQHYAEAKGFKTASAFSCYATYSQMKKNPLTAAEREKIDRKYGHPAGNAVAPQHTKPEANGEED